MKRFLGHQYAVFEKPWRADALCNLYRHFRSNPRCHAEPKRKSHSAVEVSISRGVELRSKHKLQRTYPSIAITRSILKAKLLFKSNCLTPSRLMDWIDSGRLYSVAGVNLQVFARLGYNRNCLHAVSRGCHGWYIWHGL
jgi:hypothetical protein